MRSFVMGAMRTKGSVVCAAAIAVALVPGPARASADLELVRSTSRLPNDLGWYAGPTSASIAVAGVPPDTTIERCDVGSGFINGRVGGQSFSRLYAVPASECVVAQDYDQEGTGFVSLSATLDGQPSREEIELPIDLQDPDVSIDSSVPVSVTYVRLHGTVFDGWSGPRSVSLEFTDDLGRTPTVQVSAACADCGAFHPCNLHRSPNCGWTSSWFFEGRLPAGIWHVTPIATDLAGHQGRGASRQLVVG